MKSTIEAWGINILASLNIFLALICAVLLQGCISTSLEDTAPQGATTNSSPTELDRSLPDSVTSDVSTVPQTQQLNAQTSTKYDEQGFPTFAETPRGEVDQLSSPEKIAIETKLTELLLRRESNENVRAGFEAKLRRLRKLAKTHEQNADAIISE